MFPLNLRQKMIGCFCLHLLSYIIIGITFFKDFEIFNDDVKLLISAGNLSNICLEIRRYEKNFIIDHSREDYAKVLEYINEAEQSAPRIIAVLKIMQKQTHLEDLSAKLEAYKATFRDFMEKCTTGKDITLCPLREQVRTLGQGLVAITEDLVRFEQQKLNTFIDRFRSRLIKTTLFLIVLYIYTISILYVSVHIPLKSVERAAIDIANGIFKPLPVDETAGEIRSVIRAFSKMVTDLEKQQEQLFQAKKLSSIGTLASGTAHQINNPLNNIATSCQLALSEVNREQCPFVVKMLETINQETERAGKIVRGLLEFSRAQSFSIQPYSLTEVVNKVSQLVASEIPTGIQFKTDIPEDIIVRIDVQKMVEALLNLVINAFQSIPEPPGMVTIEAAKKNDRKHAIIIISDTGTGIDKENLPKIFDPFFTTKNAANGTGLGLAVAYGIIKKQDGLIQVESEIGKGTRFIITLPLQLEPEHRPDLFDQGPIS